MTASEVSDLRARITVDPDLCNGRPTIRGLRITAETVLDHLTAGDTGDDILAAYPVLERRHSRMSRFPALSIQCML